MFAIFIFLFGLIFGSFIAAYSYRQPKDIAISDGFSFCDNCGRKINWFENIPVLSYIFLRGKCLKCGKKISIRYPIIEIVSGFAFLIIYLVIGLNILSLITSLIIYCILALIFIVDFENQLIPDQFVFMGISVIFFVNLLTNNSILFADIFAGFLAATTLLILHLVTMGKGMGLGDVKFAVLGGLIVGINNLFPWLFLAFLTGALGGIILILLGNAKMKDKIAFGPFLIISIPLTAIFGQNILRLLGFVN